jgi:thioredoxin-related protein
MKKYCFIFFLASTILQAKSQSIHWVSWETAVDMAKKENKKIFVDVYTEGCIPCRNLEITTFSQPCIINYINQYFIPVRLDARTKDKLNFKNANYEYICENGICYNELAAQLTSGDLTFPSLVFIDENQTIIQSIPNYKDPMTFEQIMAYYGQNYYFTIPWTRFERTYKPPKCQRN